MKTPKKPLQKKPINKPVSKKESDEDDDIQTNDSLAEEEDDFDGPLDDLDTFDSFDDDDDDDDDRY